MAKIINRSQSLSRGLYYDSDSDVVYIGPRPGEEAEYREVLPGVNVELDEDGAVIGIEILNASKFLRPLFSGKKTLITSK